MTQVITVSAVTAAYATQGLRPSARVSGTSPIEKTQKQLAKETMYTDDGPQSAFDIVGTSAMTLFYLTAGEKHNQPQTTREHAEEEYLLNNLEETSAQPPDLADGDEEVEEPPAEDGSQPEPLMALPDLTSRIDGIE